MRAQKRSASAVPELPEVETIRRDLIRNKLPGSIVASAEIFWHRTLSVPTADVFRKKVSGLQIKDLSRRGKYLIIELSGESKKDSFLIIHLRMSGRIEVRKNEPSKKHDRAKLVLKDGREIVFHDTRKFGRWWFVENLNEVVGKLGPEPFKDTLSFSNFEKILSETSRMLKPLLLDQTFVAGLGNIYVDEALWLAKLHPRANSEQLLESETKALHQGILKAIQTGIANSGTSLGKSEANFYSVAGRRGRNQDALNVFRRTGEACPRCRVKIERIIVGQRSTHFCPTCQPFSKKRKK